MASRSKKKQLMRPQGGQMSLETNMAMAMSKAEVARMAMEQDNSFTAVRERQNAAFRMSVDARKDALRMIETLENNPPLMGGITHYTAPCRIVERNSVRKIL